MASADVPVSPWLVDALVGAVGPIGYAQDDQAAQAAVDQAADADRAQGGG